jgi:hypothetical protein
MKNDESKNGDGDNFKIARVKTVPGTVLTHSAEKMAQFVAALIAHAKAD